MATLQQPPTPPPLDSWLGLPARWSGGEKAWLLRAVAMILSNQEALMATISDVKAAADQLAAGESQLGGSVTSLTTALTGLEQAFEALKNNPANTISPTDQASLDAAQQELTNASSDLATQLASLQTATGSIPPTA